MNFIVPFIVCLRGPVYFGCPGDDNWKHSNCMQCLSPLSVMSTLWLRFWRL